jgi:hypothetical protein
MYSDDNNDLLVNLSTYMTDAAGNATVTTIPFGAPWRTDIYNSQQSPLPNLATAAGWQAGIEHGYKQPTPTIPGPLYPYNKNPDSVHCPGDLRYQLAYPSNPSPQSGGPYCWDSYSGSAFLNGELRLSTGADGKIDKINKRTAITHTSNKFIWCEGADMRGENVGSWNMASTGTPNGSGGAFASAVFGDSPGAFHVTSAVFNFCDGHAESHKWVDSTTVAYARCTDVDKDAGSGSGAALKTAATNHKNLDAVWVGSHYAGTQNP